MPSFALLDYEPSRILMRASSRTEREVRLHSAKKEKETVAWCETLVPGDVLWDVGACVGAYSLIACSRGVEVVAFEPALHNLDSLIDNFRINGYRATILPLALGPKAGVGYLTEDAERGATHHLADQGQRCLVVAADDLVDFEVPAPTAMKVDTDGGEVGVLYGAERTLQGVRTVLVETTPDTFADCANLLNLAGLVLESSHPHASGVTNSVWRRVEGAEG